MIYYINQSERMFFNTHKEATEYIKNNSIDSKIYGVKYLGNDNVIGRNDVLLIYDGEDFKKITQIPSDISHETYNENIYYELVYTGTNQLIYVPHEGSLKDIYNELLKKGITLSEKYPLNHQKRK